jgi:hypothetical protein
MKANNCFPDERLAVLRKTLGLRIRAGVEAHRFIGIWFVVVEDRVFVRSWSVKRKGWYRTFLSESRGAIKVGDCEVAVRAVPVKSERLRVAVDRAYLERDNSAGALRYAKDLTRAKSRATTMELVPLSSAC